LSTAADPDKYWDWVLSIDVQKSKSRESNIATYHFLQAVKSLSRHDWRVEATRVAASGLQCSFAVVEEVKVEVKVSQNITKASGRTFA
jgi:hypothetical protein